MLFPLWNRHLVYSWVADNKQKSDIIIETLLLGGQLFIKPMYPVPICLQLLHFTRIFDPSQRHREFEHTCSVVIKV